MAQTGYTPILIYESGTASNVPLAANLTSSASGAELALNYADGRLYYKNGSGVVTLLASASTASNSFSAGTTGFTPSTATTGAVTLAGTLNVANGGTGLTSLTAGSLAFGAGTSAFSTLAIGTAGQILTSSGTAPQWSTLSGVAVTTFSAGTTGLTPATATSGAVTLAGTLITSNGGTGLSSYTAGDLSYYASGTALTKLAIGSANRVLTSTGSAPQWVTSLTGLTGVSSTSFTENGFAVVSQADIGTAPNEIPLNQYLGTMAYQDGTNYFNVGMTIGFRNRIINGAMRIDQRNGGGVVTTSALQSSVFTLDRWSYYNDVVSKRTIQRSSVAPAGFNNSLLVTVIATDTVGPQQFLRQGIEGFNIADLGWGTAQAQSATLSFWVRSSVTGQMGGVIQNSSANRSYPFAYTINSANTWEYKTLAIAGETSGTWLTTNGLGASISFENGPGFNAQPAGAWAAVNTSTATGSVNLCATNGATWYITGVQLEEGTQATPFDFRSIGTELELCQRYYFVYDSKRSFATIFNSDAGISTPIEFPVTMRTSPTGVGITGPNITTTGNWGIYGATNGWGAAPGYTPGFTSTVDAAAVSFSSVGGVTNNYSYLVEGGATFSAEL